MRQNPNHHYLAFTRKERIGILSLTVLILIIFIFPTFFNPGSPIPDPQAIDKFRSELSALKIRDPEDSAAYDEVDIHKVTNDEKNVASSGTDVKSSPGNKLFDFDPNEVSAAEWKRLGLKDRTIQTIQHYLSKGGSFNQPSDLQKIYGWKNEDFHRLLPFIKIHHAEQKKSSPSSFINIASYTTNKPAKDNPRFFYKRVAPQKLDINKADSIAFLSLHGIGPVLASRILRFREKLGGFYSIDQIAETYGLADSVFQKIKTFLNLHNDSLRKIDINIADENQLKIHPYIGWKLAKLIVQYRHQHGTFASPVDLQKLSILNETELRKVLPYLK